MLRTTLALELLLLLLLGVAPAHAAQWRLTADSQVVIKVYRDGPLAWLGHNHVIEPRGLQSRLSLTPTLDALLIADLRQLRVDDPVVRAQQGEGFALQPEASAIAATRANLTGAQGLDVARFPTAQVRVRGAAPKAGRQVLQVTVTLHGVTRSYPVEAICIPRRGGWVVKGEWQLQQSDFNVRPFSLLAGALRVRDRVEIVFSVSVEPG